MPASVEPTLAKTCDNLCQATYAAMTRGREKMDMEEVDFRKDIYSLKSENQPLRYDSFLEFVESQASKKRNVLMTDRTVATFIDTPLIPADGTSETDARNIRHWFARLIARGVKSSTANRYLGKMHSLYAMYSGEGNTLEPLFKELRKVVKDKSYWGDFPERESLQHIKVLPLRMQSLSATNTTMARLLFFLLYNGGQNITYGIEAKFDDTYPEIEQIHSVIDSQRVPRRKYIFPLNQGKMRPAQITSIVSSGLTSLLRHLGSHRNDGVTSHDICGWWIEAALKKNIDFETIRSIVPIVPPSHKWLSIVRPKALTDKRRLETMQTVADFINPMTAQWYVLCLRSRNTPDDIIDCIKADAPTLTKYVRFFYPTWTHVRKSGEKLIREEIPYIPHILFFKTTPDRVASFVGIIGQLAWCYKTINQPGAPYSVIPRKIMEDFQKFIGVFDVDTKIDFIKNTDLVSGTKVRITGGPYVGCEGEIIKEDKKIADPDLRTFILEIANNVTLKWEVRIEEQYLEILK